MRFLRNSFIGLFLLGSTLGLLSFAATMVVSAVQERMSGDQPNRPARERVFAANVALGESQSVRPEIRTFGEIQSRRTLELRAPASGTLVELSENFAEGGVLAAGELILAVDPTDARSSVDIAISDKNDAEVELSDSKQALTIALEEQQAAARQLSLRQQSLQRQSDLRSRGVGTDIAVENAELAVSSAEQASLTKRKAVAQAEARVGQAQSLVARRMISLAEAERRLAKTRLVAEFDGILSNVSVVQGGLVTVNERIGQLVDPAELEASFIVSNQQYVRLIDRAGLLRPFEVRLEGAALAATAKLARESATVAEGQTGRLLFASVDGGRASGLRPGDFVSVTIVEDQLDDVVLLPATSVSSDNTVLLVGEDDRLEEVETRVMRKQGDDVIVSSRQLEGRMIVTSRTPVLGAGIKVRPILPEGAAIPDAPQTIALSEEERAELIAFVESNTRMPEQVKQRMLDTLRQDEIPQNMIDRLRSRMGG